jgi:hypothetical protein
LVNSTDRTPQGNISPAGSADGKVPAEQPAEFDDSVAALKKTSTKASTTEVGPLQYSLTKKSAG